MNCTRPSVAMVDSAVRERDGMSKQTDYQNGRMDGLLLALKIVRDGGVEALEKECQLRGAWKIHTNLAMKELDKATEPMKDILYDTILIASLSALHDTFGFGQIRCQRYVRNLDKFYQYLHHGWIYWYDVIEELKERLRLSLEFSKLNPDTTGRTYAHPEPEDVYTEQDLVAPEYWKGILKELNYSEIKDGKEYFILDENGKPLMCYQTKYDQIGVYDALTGIAIVKGLRD